MIWLSVIVPTYNGAAFLARALDSIAAENDDGTEVIAIDDGSTDATCEILTRYQSRLNLKLIHRRVGNWTVNTNYGLQLGKGEYACFLHQDDAWLPGRQAALRRQIAETPQATLLLHACKLIDPADRTLGVWRCPYPPHVLLSAERALEHLLVQNFIAIPGAVFRREAALAVRGLDESLWFTADWDLWLKLAAIGPTIYLPKLLGAFRLHPESQTADRSQDLDDFRAQLEGMAARHAGGEQLPAVLHAARASVEVNVALAAAYHRKPIPWRRLIGTLSGLTLNEWHRFLRDSRLWERVVARVRGGFAARRS